jgi:hypothetical protein
MTNEQNEALAEVLAAASRARAVGVTENHIIRAIQKMDIGGFLSALDALSRPTEGDTH